MSGSKFLIPDITTLQDLSSAALSFTTSIGREFKLNKIAINFNDGATPPVAVAVTETVTIKLNSAKGAIYDTILAKIDLIAESDFVWRPSGEETYQSGDEITITCTNANTTGIAHMVIKAEELYT